MSKLPFSILKNNKLFSVSLFTIYVIVSIVFVIITFFYSSITASIDNFLGEYGIADATVLVDVTSDKVAEQIEELSGTFRTDAIMMLEGKTNLENGEVFTLRYSSIPDKGKDGSKFYNTETKKDVVTDENSVLISSKFAEKNEIGSGDKLEISLAGQTVELTVTDVISCPETIYVARDVNSWFDDTQYGFVYVSENIMQEKFGTGGMANRFDIWFEDGADGESIISDISKKLTSLGINIKAETLLEDSTVYYQIHSAIDGTKSVLAYLPVIIFAIGILFGSFFIFQIIVSSERTVGILRALGTGNGRICLIFILYNTIVCTASIITGGILGTMALKFLLGIYENTFALPDVLIECDFYRIPLAIIAIYAIGVISCVICIGKISQYDPAVIVSGEGGKKIYKIPAFIEKLPLDSWKKISASQILRNKRRMAIMCICNIACLLLTFMSVAVLESKIEGMRFAFEERFGYDFVIISDDAESMKEITSWDDVENAEFASTFVFDYEGEYMRIEAISPDAKLTTLKSPKNEKLSASDEGIILEEGFARRHNLDVGAVIEINGSQFTVTDISREYFYSTQYISLDNAGKLGALSPNVLYVSLKNSDAAGDFKLQLANMDTVECFYSVDTRRESAESSMNAMDAPCYLFALLGILIGAIIVSNMNIISIQRRKKEFATLAVIGSSGKQFNSMLFFDMMVQFVASIVPGIPISCMVSQWILKGMSSISMEYVLVNIPLISAVSAGAVLLYLLVSLILAKRAINHLNYVEILAKR